MHNLQCKGTTQKKVITFDLPTEKHRDLIMVLHSVAHKEGVCKVFTQRI